MNARLKVVAILLLVIGAVVIARGISKTPGVPRLDGSSFYDAVAEGRVEEVNLAPDAIGCEIRGQFKSTRTPAGASSGGNFTTYVLEDSKLSTMLRTMGVSVKTEKPRRGIDLSFVGSWLFLLLLAGILILVMRRLRGDGARTSSLGRSRAKRSSSAGKITFADVAGAEEAKQELQEIIEFLKAPEKFQRLGGRIPTGVLLVGPTGTGKTLLARAVAGEAGVPFFFISGADFVEMFVGVGASRVRDLFEQGRKNAPCIIFVDEIDAVGRQRGAGFGGGHDEREQTLNQLLVELDGFDDRADVIVLAATNRPDVLDPALLRPGRFDRQVIVDRPDVRGREAIIRVHVGKAPLNADVDLGLIARGTPGFSGAELANLVNEAALYAVGRSQEAVAQEDFERAKDRALMGIERRTLVISAEERQAMAFHEAGHALIAHLLPEADPLHKVTIVPRGLTLGATQQLPLDDRHIASKPHLLAMISVLMGGRAAEEAQLGRVSSGAAEDFERATRLARKMVTRWGMSESLGPLTYGKPQEQVFLGRDIAQHRNYSEATAVEIDREVRKIVTGCHATARRMLVEHADALTRVAGALLAHETLTAEQVGSLVRGEALRVPLATSADRREPIDAAREREQPHDGRKRAAQIGDGLPLLPAPGARPA